MSFPSREFHNKQIIDFKLVLRILTVATPVGACFLHACKQVLPTGFFRFFSRFLCCCIPCIIFLGLLKVSETMVFTPCFLSSNPTLFPQALCFLSCSILFTLQLPIFYAEWPRQDRVFPLPTSPPVLATQKDTNPINCERNEANTICHMPSF